MVGEDKILSAIYKRALEIYPNLLIDLKGSNQLPHNSIEEWVSLEILNSIELPTQTPDVNSDRQILVQLTCYSLHAELRKDTSLVAPWTLANKLKPLLHRSNYVIESSCFRFHDCKMVYLDLKSSSDASKHIVENNPSFKIHSVIITSNGKIQ